MTTIRSALHRLGLPSNLVALVRDERLLAEVELAYAEYEKLQRSMDAWEAANPEAARKAPWYEGREAWKRAGRPKPAWYELLYWRAGWLPMPVNALAVREATPNTGVKYKRLKRERLRAEAASRSA